MGGRWKRGVAASQGAGADIGIVAEVGVLRAAWIRVLDAVA